MSSTKRRRGWLGWLPAVRRLGTTATLFAALLLAAPSPSTAADRARLSADLTAALAAGSPSIDVIVHGTRAEVDLLAARYNLRVRKYLKTGGVLRVNAGQLEALQVDGSQDHLSSDIRIRSTADVTAATVLADKAWSGLGGLAPLSGAGIGIAVIDSGMDPDHVALKNRVIATMDFTGGNGVDGFGHGTHVAALVAGQTSQAPDSGEHRGIAFGAHIINLRVLNDRGAGTASSVIEAIDWAIDNRELYQIRVINLSIGAPVLQPYRDDPLCEAVERAVAAGIVVVASAGNDGVARDGTLQYGSVTSPGNDPNVITVGALDVHGTPDRRDDTVAAFSSRGPTTYDLVMKPDLVAPGAQVIAAEAARSLLTRIRPERHVTGFGENAYMELSGTSMSAGVVSGAVALLLEERPRLSAADVKAILQVTASPMLDALASGAGSLDVFAAARLAEGLSAEPASWPGGRVNIWRIGEVAPGNDPASAGGPEDSRLADAAPVFGSHGAIRNRPTGASGPTLALDEGVTAGSALLDPEFEALWAANDQ